MGVEPLKLDRVCSFNVVCRNFINCSVNVVHIVLSEPLCMHRASHATHNSDSSVSICSDASFFDPHKQTKNAPPPPLAERSSLSCTAASGIQNNPSQETLASKSSFETFEQYFYYYEKQNRQKDRDLGHEEYEGFEDEELEIPFTNTMKRTKGKSGQSGKRRGRHGVAQGGLEEDDDFVPPFYDSNELRPIVDRGGGGGPGGEGGSASRRKGSRIPKKVTLHQMHQDSQDPSSGGGKNYAMLPKLFCTERVESFDLSRDRNEIIQYHECCT